MATDKSEPRTGLIATLAVCTVITLVVIRAGLQSYFITMSEAELHSKVNGVPADMLDRIHGTEIEGLARGDITRAMAAVGAGERAPSITPRVSTDFAALQGWTLRPLVFHAPSAAPAPSGAPVPGGSAPPSASPSAAPSAAPSGVPSAAPSGGSLLPEARQTGTGGAQGASAAPSAASASPSAAAPAAH